MAGFWPSSFLCFIYRDKVEVNKKRKKIDQYTAILTERAWSIIYPQVANQNEGFPFILRKQKKMNRQNITRQKNLCWQDVTCQLSIYKRPCFWTQNDPEWNKSKWSIRNTKPGPQAKLRVLEDNHSSMLLLPNKCLLTHRPLNGNKHSVPTSVPLKCLNSFVF